MIRVKRFKNIHDYFAGPMYRISWCYCKSHRLYYSINPYRVIWEMSTIINYREVRCTRFAKLRTMFARSAAMVILSYFFLVLWYSICYFDFPVWLVAAIRRQSLARLHSMAIEGPITKAMSIISAAQESCPHHVSQALEKVNIIQIDWLE